MQKEIKIQISHRVDQEIRKGNSVVIKYAFAFINIVGSKKYLTTTSRKYVLLPLIRRLTDNLDNFSVENQCVDELFKYAGYIPRELLFDYVNAITQTYIGYIGGSSRYNRTDFYANGAATRIPVMFESFDDESAHAFIDVIKSNSVIQSRIGNQLKLNRLRTLGKIVKDRVSESFDEIRFLSILLDEKKEREFFDMVKKKRYRST